MTVQVGPHSPPVCGEHVVGVAQTVAPRQRAVRQLLLAVFPGEGHAVHLLLPLRSDGAAASTAVGGVFPRDVALPVTAHYRAPNTQETPEIRSASAGDVGCLLGSTAAHIRTDDESQNGVRETALYCK